MSTIDFDDLPREKIRYLSFNAGQAAAYVDSGDDNEETRRHKEVEGVILGSFKGHGYFGGINTPFPQHKLVCQATNWKHPAQVNEKLTEAEKERLVELGWTGDCSTCFLAQFDDATKRTACPPQHRIPFLWNHPTEGPTVVLLTFKSRTAWQGIGGFLAQFRTKDCFDYRVKFSRRMEKNKDGIVYAEPVAAKLGPVEAEHRAAMQDLAEQHTASMKEARRNAEALPEPRTRSALPSRDDDIPPPTDEDIPF